MSIFISHLRYWIGVIRNYLVARRIRIEKAATKYHFEEVGDEQLRKRLLSMDIGDLRAQLLEGTVTSVQLVHLYSQRCYTIDRELNLSAQELFNDALKLAAERDAERADAIKNGTQDQLPYLHGIPISVKDLFSQKGYPATCGCAMRNQIETEDSACVVPLLEAGAIPIVRGNVPQLCTSIHSYNRMYGEAKNPHDRKRSCGGSSGGDAGLVAACCVPIALGTDLGSSIRIPAAFNGIYGFKPTQGRLPTRGQNLARFSYDLTEAHFVPSPGPLGKSVRDLIEFFKI